jgi:hypothetical protein
MDYFVISPQVDDPNRPGGGLPHKIRPGLPKMKPGKRADFSEGQNFSLRSSRRKNRPAGRFFIQQTKNHKINNC